MDNKTEIQYEEMLSVSDYPDFESCQKDTEKAKTKFVERLREMFPGQDEAWEIGTIAFQEFDSTNPGHACAYFLCNVRVNPNALFWAFAEHLEETS